MIKLSAVAKNIKRADDVYWIKQDDWNYIGSTHFMIKTKQVIQGVLLTALLVKLEDIPRDGEGIRNGVSLDDPKRIVHLTIDKEQDLIPMKDTDLIHACYDGVFARVFKMGDQYKFLDQKFVDMLDPDMTLESKKGKYLSAFFTSEDEKVMILPIKMEKDNEYLK